MPLPRSPTSTPGAKTSARAPASRRATTLRDDCGTDEPRSSSQRSATTPAVFTDYDPDEPDAEPGVQDVRSRSEEIGTDGRPYAEW